MPLQIGLCEGCGEVDHLEYVHGKEKGVFLCRYCKFTLEEDGEIELMDGSILHRQ